MSSNLPELQTNFRIENVLTRNEQVLAEIYFGDSQTGARPPEEFLGLLEEGKNLGRFGTSKGKIVDNVYEHTCRAATIIEGLMDLTPLQKSEAQMMIWLHDIPEIVANKGKEFDSSREESSKNPEQKETDRINELLAAADTFTQVDLDLYNQFLVGEDYLESKNFENRLLCSINPNAILARVVDSVEGNLTYFTQLFKIMRIDGVVEIDSWGCEYLINYSKNTLKKIDELNNYTLSSDVGCLTVAKKLIIVHLSFINSMWKQIQVRPKSINEMIKKIDQIQKEFENTL